MKLQAVVEVAFPEELGRMGEESLALEAWAVWTTTIAGVSELVCGRGSVHSQVWTEDSVPSPSLRVMILNAFIEGT